VEAYYNQRNRRKAVTLIITSNVYQKGQSMNHSKINVHNLNGTTKNKRSDGSWKNWWKAESGRKWGNCSCCGCESDDNVIGAHVQKVSGGNEWYIVPLCKKCNQKSSEEVFGINADDLVPINP
jgi:hypothetical protein